MQGGKSGMRKRGRWMLVGRAGRGWLECGEGWGGWGEALVTQMELKLCVIGRDPCKCKGPVVEPHRHHRPVWKSAEREEQWDVRLESGKE